MINTRYPFTFLLQCETIFVIAISATSEIDIVDVYNLPALRLGLLKTFKIGGTCRRILSRDAKKPTQRSLPISLRS